MIKSVSANIKKHFEKGYTPNWTEEIFIIDKINMTNPVTYQVRGLNNEKKYWLLLCTRAFLSQAEYI